MREGNLSLLEEAGFLEIFDESGNIRSNSIIMGRFDILLIIDPWLCKYPGCPLIRQPAVVYKGTQPYLDAMATTKLLFSNKNVDAPVPITDRAAVNMGTQLILFDPVYLEIAEWSSVPAPDGRKAMPAAE